LWKGGTLTPTACIDAVIENPSGPALRYGLSFTEVAQRFEIKDERIENERPAVGHPAPYFYYHFQGGRPVLNVKGKERGLQRENIELNAEIRTNIQKSPILPKYCQKSDCIANGALVGALHPDFRRRPIFRTIYWSPTQAI
jgi:hypothetical protein